MKKNRLLEQLEELGLVDKNLSGAAKHSKLKGLLNPISIAGGLDNPLVEVEYKGRQSNIILTTQGESTLKIFGVPKLDSSTLPFRHILDTQILQLFCLHVL